MNIYDEKKQQEFLDLRVMGKSLKTIASEIDVPIELLIDWDFELAEEINETRMLEYDKILEAHNLTSLERFKHLALMYDKLKTELDKRDFSGLPTDKLYVIFNDVYARLRLMNNPIPDDDFYDDEPPYDLPEDLD